MHPEDVERALRKRSMLSERDIDRQGRRGIFEKAVG
jgi:hypothetical protein